MEAWEKYRIQINDWDTLDKRKFQSEYKFSIAFENDAYRPGYSWYITEKIMESMTVNSVPIYKGADRIGQDFNQNSFINCHNYTNLYEVIDHIVHIDENQVEYLKLLNQSWFENNDIPENNKIKNIKLFLFRIFI
jgi:hypothetical protein